MTEGEERRPKRKAIKVFVVLGTLLFGLYAVVVLTRPAFMFDVRKFTPNRIRLNNDQGPFVLSYGALKGSQRWFSDGVLGNGSGYDGLCYVEIGPEDHPRYLWGIHLEVSHMFGPPPATTIELH